MAVMRQPIMDAVSRLRQLAWRFTLHYVILNSAFHVPQIDDQKVPASVILARQVQFVEASTYNAAFSIPSRMCKGR